MKIKIPKVLQKEGLEMDSFAIRIIIVLIFMFNHNILADSGPAIERQPFQHISSDTNKVGMVKTEMTIYHGKLDFEIILMIHDRKGNLKYSKYHVWKKGKLVQTVNNGVLRTIVSGSTPCDFAVVESSGDTIFFNLDPKKKPNEDPEIEENRAFLNSKIPPKYKYEAILYNRWSNGCEYHSGFY
jgi:hypothetical protein